MKKITVTFNENGTVTTHVEGQKGVTCKDINNAIAKAIGAEIINRTPTAEMYQKVVQEVKGQVQV